jgi:hypothetical protein
MVTGKPLAELHTEFIELAGMTFHDAKAHENHLIWWDACATMQKRYHLAGQAGSTFVNHLLDTPTMDGHQTKKYLTKTLLYGKGILGIHVIGKFAHAVAFEDGMILDPEIEGTMTLETFKRVHRLNRPYTWRIDRVDPTVA